MDTSSVLQVANIIVVVLLMPVASSLYSIQGRLSKVEGLLEAILEGVGK